MGWCSGTDVAEKWFGQIKRSNKGKPKALETATFEMIAALEEQDWDCQDDMEDPVFLHIWGKYKSERYGEDE